MRSADSLSATQLASGLAWRLGGAALCFAVSIHPAIPDLQPVPALGIIAFAGFAAAWGLHCRQRARHRICSDLARGTCAAMLILAIAWPMAADGFGLASVMLTLPAVFAASIYVIHFDECYRASWCPSCPTGIAIPATSRKGLPARCKICQHVWKDHEVVTGVSEQVVVDQMNVGRVVRTPFRSLHYRIGESDRATRDRFVARFVVISVAILVLVMIGIPFALVASS